MVCIYVAFLAVSVLRDRLHREAAPGAPPAPPAGEAELATEPESESAGEALGDVAPAPEPFLSETIRDWKRILGLVEEARSLRQGGRPTEAAERLERAAADPVTIGELQLALAGMRREQRRYAEARDLLMNLLAHNPAHREARLLLAEVLVESGRNEDALAAAQWILEDEPYAETAHRIAASALTQMGKVDQAIPHLNRLVLLNRDNMTSRNALGQAYLQLGNLNQALKTFEEVKELDADNSEAHFYSAVCFARMQEMPGLTEVMTTAASLFGRDFVLAWVKSPEFDAIRDNTEFQALLDRLGRPPQAG